MKIDVLDPLCDLISVAKALKLKADVYHGYGGAFPYPLLKRLSY
jgi:hypothetical protein